MTTPAKLWRSKVTWLASRFATRGLIEMDVAGEQIANERLPDARLTAQRDRHAAHLGRDAIGPGDRDATHGHRDVLGLDPADAALADIDPLRPDDVGAAVLDVEDVDLDVGGRRRVGHRACGEDGGR